VLLSNGDNGSKKMEIGKKHAGKTFIDHVGRHTTEVIVDEEVLQNFLLLAVLYLFGSKNGSGVFILIVFLSCLKNIHFI